MTEVVLSRANKVTAQFEGEGVMVATFYRTHNKLGQVKSSEILGFVPLEGEDVTPAQKLEAFKDFIKANATLFNYTYDPVDRRSEGAKYPSSYTAEVLLETATTILNEKMEELHDSVQGQIDNLVKNGHMAVGSGYGYSIGAGVVNVQEAYKSGNLKYADVTFPVALTVGELASAPIDVKITLVSGQIKKPREFGQYVFTMTGIKNALIDSALIPKIEKPVIEPEVAADASAEAVAQ